MKISGLTKVRRNGIVVAWYWTASQVSRLSEGFAPRTVCLWRGEGEPRPEELPDIRARAEQLSLDLHEWLHDPTQKRRGKRGTIYIVRAGDAVKIGFTRTLPQRLAQLQTFHPNALELLAAFPGSPLIERGLHRRFASARLTGEWFRWTSEIARVAFEKSTENNVRTAGQNHRSKVRIA